MGGRKKGTKLKPEPGSGPEMTLAAPAPEPRKKGKEPKPVSAAGLMLAAAALGNKGKKPVSRSAAAPAPVQGPMTEPDVVCKVKAVEFGGAARTVVYPPLPRHRSALLALVNALLLSGRLTAGIDAPSQVSLQHFLLRMKRHYGRLLKNQRREASQEHIMDTIKNLSRPIDISVCFTRIDGIVSNSVDLAIFGHMGVPLYNLWMVDSQDAGVATAVGADYYEIFRALYPYDTPVPRPNSDQTVLDFLQGTGLTTFGLQEVNKAMENDQTSVVFWNKTFHTIMKHNGVLYALHNDLSSFETDVLWRELNVEGDGRFCSSNFVPVVVHDMLMPTAPVEVESQPAWEQLDLPDVTAVDAKKVLAALATGSQSQKHKCIRQNCPLHFHSILNLHRHNQVHLKDRKAKMDPANKIDIAKFWDQLSDEDSIELLSIKNAPAIKGITGDMIYRSLEEIGPEDGFYNIAKKLKFIIHSSEKVSSEDLFAVLDEASEKTVFSTDIKRYYPDYSIFDRGLHEVSDTIACCSYFLEQSLMERWFEFKEYEASRNAAILLGEEAESSSCGKNGSTQHTSTPR